MNTKIFAYVNGNTKGMHRNYSIYYSQFPTPKIILLVYNSGLAIPLFSIVCTISTCKHTIKQFNQKATKTVAASFFFKFDYPRCSNECPYQ